MESMDGIDADWLLSIMRANIHELVVLSRYHGRVAMPLGRSLPFKSIQFRTQAQPILVIGFDFDCLTSNTDILSTVRSSNFITPDNLLHGPLLDTLRPSTLFSSMGIQHQCRCIVLPLQYTHHRRTQPSRQFRRPSTFITE